MIIFLISLVVMLQVVSLVSNVKHHRLTHARINQAQAANVEMFGRALKILKHLDRGGK